jgi:hypothetical protein
MPIIIKPTTTIKEQHFTETKQGEITVNINLTLTIDHNGSVSVKAESKQEEKDFITYIPDLEPTGELLEFGKDTTIIEQE